MNVVLRKKSYRKTWIQIFKEAQQIKSVEDGQSWLEKMALNYKKRLPGMTLQGAKVLIKENLTYLSDYYFTPKDRDRLKRFIGLSRRYER